MSITAAATQATGPAPASPGPCRGLAGLRVLHLGNIANNAYNNAKFLRRLGVLADAVSRDYRHVMAQPEWEDADLVGSVDELEPRWSDLDLGGFRRPEWFRDLETRALNVRGQPRQGPGRVWTWVEREKTRAAQGLERVGLHRNPGRGWSWPASWGGRTRALARLPWAGLCYGLGRANVLREQRDLDLSQWAPSERAYLDRLLAGGRVGPADLAWGLPLAAKLRPLLTPYPLVQAYGTEPIAVLLASGGRPYIAFEHGTLRELPFEDSPQGRLLAEAYRRASRVLITNPDVIGAADRLGLSNHRFIPHPIDEERLAPGPSRVGVELRARFPGATLILAPSRQNWAIKGSDRLIRGFAAFLRSGRQGILLLARWGQEVERSEALIQDLGIGAACHWFRPAHKALLLDYYRAADLVCDQFEIGSFGTLAPEAMAVGVPVVLHYDDAVQRWAFPERPPVLSARAAEEIQAALERLHDDPARRRELGERSRGWVVRWHGWRRVAERHCEIYREAMAGAGPAADDS